MVIGFVLPDVLGGVIVDVFRFLNPTEPTMMQQGKIINGLKSKMWVERFIEAGEFKFVADVNSGAKEALPLGSFISHANTKEIMIVEDHEITEEEDKTPEIVITGRSLDSFLEQRLVTETGFWTIRDGQYAWRILFDDPWDQVVTLINTAIANPGFGFGDVRNLVYVSAITQIGGTGERVDRPLREEDDIYTSLIALLKLVSLGVKTIRPGPWSPFGAPYNTYSTALLVHRGVDVSNRVILSSDTGEIANANYLWSSRKYKTVARVKGKHQSVSVFIPPFTASPTELDYRAMYVDAKDIYENVDTSGFVTADWDRYDALLTKRGEQALAGQKQVVLTRADVVPNLTKFKYRTDFDIGDIITVNGNYNATSKMRIVEHVEIEDETGIKAYPTLELL